MEKSLFILLKHCFKGLSESYVEENFGYRLNAIELIKKEQYIPNAFLLLDFSVDADVEMQYLPFFEELNQITGDIDDRIHVIIQWRNKGHQAQNYDEIINILKYVEKYMDRKSNLK